MVGVFNPLQRGMRHRVGPFDRLDTESRLCLQLRERSPQSEVLCCGDKSLSTEVKGPGRRACRNTAAGGSPAPELSCP
jgi:hypothetical protein